MEYTELIHSRESVRNYDPKRPVPVEILKKILDAGRLAPSACNYQPWKFLVISSSALLEKVKACYRREWLKDAPHIVVVLGLRNQAWNRSYDGYNSIETDVAIAMTHIILAAENEGVGACWIAAYDPALLKEVLKPGENELIFGITPLGYPKAGYKKTLIKKRKSLEEIVEFMQISINSRLDDSRSHEAMGFLISKGFSNLANLAGGITDWERDGLPLRIDRTKQLDGSCVCQLRPRHKKKK